MTNTEFQYQSVNRRFVKVYRLRIAGSIMRLFLREREPFINEIFARCSPFTRCEDGIWTGRYWSQR